MISKPEIINAMQFSFFIRSDPINVTGNARETITWQYAGTSEPVDFSSSSDFVGWSEFAAAEKAAFDAALAHIETFLNVDFVEVTGSDDPDLNVGKVELPGSTTGIGGPSISYSGTTISRWDAFVVFDNPIDLSQDSETDLLLHELGHALGLDHPFDSTVPVPEALDNNKYSLMAYAANPDNGQDSDAMMLFDIYALQDIWGAADYLTGDTSYTGKRTDTVDAIWDTGGTDIFDASAKTNAVVLDLNEGAFSTFDSYPDVVIAHGVEIENAKGGFGDDTITGNTLANLLLGRSGDDTVSGDAGNDRIKGGNGQDQLNGQDGRDKLWGQNGDDTLDGGNGRDILKGGTGKDTLIGGAGKDKLIGNQGADRFVFSLNGDKDKISDFQDDLDEIQFTGLGNIDEILSNASDLAGNVVFEFGDGDRLTVLNSTLAEISDDIVI